MPRSREIAYLSVFAISGVLSIVFFYALLGPIALLLIPVEAWLLWFIYNRRQEALARMRQDVQPRPDVRPPVAPVDVDDLSAIPEPIRACPDCLFIGVRMPNVGDGLWPGGGELGDRVVCPRCGFQGLAVSFETREDYAASLRARAETAP